MTVGIGAGVPLAALAWLDSGMWLSAILVLVILVTLPFRWLLWFVLTVAVGTAVLDTVFGSVRNGVASCIYLVLLRLELFWWPNRQRQPLADADRAGDIAQHVLAKSQA
jgi:hypothetical protein